MKFDVVIIGASSSGLYAAELLTRAGKRVGLFERQEKFNPARRTLIVTPELRSVVGQVPPEATLHRTGTIVLSSSRRSASIRLATPDPIVERRRLLGWFSEKLENAGVAFFRGWRFAGIREASCGVQVRFRSSTRDVEVLAREAVIGADGVFSSVGRLMEISRPPFVPILQAEVALPQDWNSDITQVWFDPRETRFFYWLIPESIEKAVVGLVGDHGAQTRELLKRFLFRHNLKAQAYQGAFVAMHHPRLKPWCKVGKIPVYLVGDAAGQVKVTTVGGTVSGLLGAQAAVRALVRNTRYKAELRYLKRELDTHWIIRALLDRLDNQGYDLLISSVTERVRQFLGRYNRDSIASVLWRLPFLEPRLALVAHYCLWGRADKSEKTAKGQQIPVVDVD